MQVQRSRTRVLVATAGAGVAALVALSACSAGGSDAVGQNGGSPVGDVTGAATSATPSPTHSNAPAVITTSAVDSTAVNPTTPVTVSIAHGTLSSVVLHNAAGKDVTGNMGAGGTSWKSSEVLGYGKTYTLTAKGSNAQGTPVTKTASIKTISPNIQTTVDIDYTGDYALDNGGTYGVGIVPTIVFGTDVPTSLRSSVQKAVTISTTPKVTGAFAWQDSQHLLWRPENYWPAGTKVDVKANTYGLKVGDGNYGASDESVHFTIGRKQITKAVDSAPNAVDKVRVYNAAGTVLRTMNTSMGEHSGTYANGSYINFYTLDGTYTVIHHENPAIMSSDSYGLPATAAGGYAPEPIYWATKISVDGIYLHELTTTEWAQNSGQDVSHGCLNLNTANATWFYKHSLVGDPVEIDGAKGAPHIQVWQGGAWSVPWKDWVAGNLS